MRRSQRSRKPINYLDVLKDNERSPLNAVRFSVSPAVTPPIAELHSKNSIVTEEEAEDVTVTEAEGTDYALPKSESESSSDEDENSSRKKRKLSLKPSLPNLEILAADDDDEEDEYKKQREENMRERQKILETMRIDDEMKELGNRIVSSPIVGPVIPPRKRSQPARRSQKKSFPEHVGWRKSPRMATRSSGPVTSDPSQENNVHTNDSNHDEQDQVIEEELNLAGNDGDKDFFEQIKELPKVSYNSVSDFVSYDYDKFSGMIRSCRMYHEPIKIIPSRICSLAFHRSEDKLLLVCGDKQGHVSLYGIGMAKGITLKPHGYSTNCVSFSEDGSKFFSTALDGTTRVGDIETRSSTLLYNSMKDESDDTSHTTWHHQWGQQLMVARGDGCVKFLDLRAPSENTFAYKCHQKSVRTVQLHPENENYFLTSSGVGVFAVFDIRQRNSKQGPIILESLGKALTSAFYSAKGSYVLTTSNDDTIRVYDCRNQSAKLHVKIPHNNHCGRWLSVFKARWHPQREDCFYVGSLLSNPKRMQAYTINGKILHEFCSPRMETHCPVITVHQTKPIIVGGNSSGKIHIYSPFQDLLN